MDYRTRRCLPRFYQIPGQVCLVVRFDWKIKAILFMIKDSGLDEMKELNV